MRYGPNRLSVCTDSGMKAIYGSKANVRKSDWYLVFGLAFDVENVFSMLHRGKHAIRRRILSQTFTPSAIDMLQEHIISNVERLCVYMNDSVDAHYWSTPKDMSQWIGYVTTDIVGDLCFTRNWNLLGSNKNRDLLQAFEDGSGALSIVSIPWKFIVESH